MDDHEGATRPRASRATAPSSGLRAGPAPGGHQDAEHDHHGEQHEPRDPGCARGEPDLQLLLGALWSRGGRDQDRDQHETERSEQHDREKRGSAYVVDPTRHEGSAAVRGRRQSLQRSSRWGWAKVSPSWGTLVSPSAPLVTTSTTLKYASDGERLPAFPDTRHGGLRTPPMVAYASTAAMRRA